MTIWEHLEELRKRIILAALGMLVTTILGWTFRVQILAWLLKPYENAWTARHFLGAPELQTLSPADAFVGYLQLSLVAGFVGAVPFIFFSTSLFLSGVAFAYYVAFPFSFGYFFSLLGKVSDQGTVLTQKPTLEFFLDFSTRMLLAFGGVFELPLFISFLAIAGVVTPMQLLKFGRWAILCSFIVGAVVTPGPEVSSQLAVSGALVALYFLSIGIAFIVGKRKSE